MHTYKRWGWRSKRSVHPQNMESKRGGGVRRQIRAYSGTLGFGNRRKERTCKEEGSRYDDNSVHTHCMDYVPSWWAFTIGQITLILPCRPLFLCSGLMVLLGPLYSLCRVQLSLYFSRCLHGYHHSSPGCPTCYSFYLAKGTQYLQLLRTSSFPDFLCVLTCITIPCRFIRI